METEQPTRKLNSSLENQLEKLWYLQLDFKLA